MAIDFLIFGLILISLFVNLLALGAFWVTPGLRTMANRFVINLLIINIIGCIILTPPLFITQQSQLEKQPQQKESQLILQNHQKQQHHEQKNYLNTILEDQQLSFHIKSSNNEDNNNSKIIEENDIDIVNDTIITSKTLMKCNNNGKCNEIIMTNNDDSETIIITEMEINNIPSPALSSSSASVSSSEIKSSTIASNEQNLNNDEINNDNSQWLEFSKSSSKIKKQRWFLDLAAALGALSVLLVVGDTWCAVTDPLRYHTRISAFKSWILITCTWSLGILFGLISALLENVFTINWTTTTPSVPSTIIPQDFQSDNNYQTFDNNYYDDDVQLNFNNNHHQLLLDNQKIELNLYSMIYSCIYFIIIILLPFGFVCGMYWRIFSEARKNGLRMRQNGSSPLLQSALNLTTNTIQQQNQHQQQPQLQNQNHHPSCLTMKIDKKNCNDKDVLNPLLIPPIKPPSSLSLSFKNDNDIILHDDDDDDDDNNCHSMVKQNIFLTLSKANNDNIRRNSSSSAKQLNLLETSSTLSSLKNDLNEIQKKSGLRLVQSTPNLMNKTKNDQHNNKDNNIFDHHRHILMNFSSSSHNNNSHQNHHHHTNGLQIPPLNVSPKSLSYMTSIRHRLSNASSLFKYREESRAARISILVVIMFLISYLPYGIFILLQQRLNIKFFNSIQIAILMILFSNLSSPFIFAYRNKRVRRGVKRLFGLDKQSKELRINRKFVLLRCRNNNKIHRNTSKASNYSTNSIIIKNQFLTPLQNNINDSTFNGQFLTDIEKFPNNNLTKNIHKHQNSLIEKIHHHHHHHQHCAILQEKKSFLKIFCDSSRKLGCATNSCANSDNEQVDV